MTSNPAVAFYSSKSFYASRYLDNELEDCKSIDEAHEKVRQLMPTLALTSRDMSMQLSQYVDDLVKLSSRAPLDIELLTQETQALARQIARVQPEVDQLKLVDDSPAKQLVDLQTRHDRLQDAIDILERAAKWDTSGIDKLIDNKDYAAAEAWIDEASKLLIVWRGNAEERSKSDQLQKAKARLQAARQPAEIVQRAATASPSRQASQRQSRTATPTKAAGKLRF